MSKQAIPNYIWFLPLLPCALAFAIYFSELQISSFQFINGFTQLLPDTLWAWLTFLGNGWGIFALASPLLLLAPRLLTAGIFGGVISGLSSSILKNIFDLPRPAGLLSDGSFHRIGEPLLFKAFPSGHTLTAFAIASALYFATPRDKRSHLLILFGIASLVGLSRIAVGAHWPTDVLAGSGVGMWCGMLGALLALRVPQSQLIPRAIWSRLIALGGIVAIYVHITQIMDLELNLPLQYASIAVIAITLVFFIRAQFTPSSGNLG
ncbi:PA-phosphatase [Polynucleobacter sp. QLW-P1DATA-2]|uniref:phosphatase PAP2 family protein n=1 Tax=unclassified Polynucleobacter TaxID=2640945 RepID=UPI0008F80419|nr:MULTISPECIES: phosphatase PAP2 family protein [unclassified Polynucleobacter]OIM98357.1 PA-phosphatase [Polynucleobacter sp. MWH-Tro8-2-5-gr]OIN00271.1 PA-phosphatase [Polynucleobacter sp. QLW-P1DATA-2]